MAHYGSCGYFDRSQFQYLTKAARMNIIFVLWLQLMVLILATLHTAEGRAVGDLADFVTLSPNLYDVTPPPLTKNTLVQETMSLFDHKLDKNPKDGSLTQEEFEMAAVNGGFSLDWDQFVKLTDKNCDGAISKEEFRFIGDMSWDITALDKNADFFISKEELGDDNTWDTLAIYIKERPYSHEPVISMEDYSIYLADKIIESTDPCVSPSLAQQMEVLFDVDDGGNKLDDALDRVVVYRVRAAGTTSYYKGRAERIDAMED